MINYKEMMIDCWQKEQSSIKKMKSSIFQTRMIEFEK